MDFWNGAPWTPREWQSEAMPIVWRAIEDRESPIVSAIMGAGKSVFLSELAYQEYKRGGIVVISTSSQDLVEQLYRTVGMRIGEEYVGRCYTRIKTLTTPVIIACNDSMKYLAEYLQKNQIQCTLWIADEAHKTEAPEMHAAIDLLSPLSRVGITATPFRSSAKESIQMFEKCVYSYSMGDAIRDGVLTPFRVKNILKSELPDGASLTSACITLIQRYASGPGIVSATSILDAEETAEILTAHGIRSEAIHSRLSVDTRNRLISDLECGRIRCLVHVSLLAEGVDFPWLRWLCLRRPVKAKVRFLQEIGRVLRSNPGKTEALILDPLDLFSEHSLHIEHQIGSIEKKEEEENKKSWEDWDIPPLPAVDSRAVPAPKAVDAAKEFTNNLLLNLEISGVVKQKSFPGDSWRESKPTEKQLITLDKMKWSKRYLPEAQRQVVGWLCDRRIARRLSRGAVTDLITILIGLADVSSDSRKKRRHWKMPSEVNLQEIQNFF